MRPAGTPTRARYSNCWMKKKLTDFVYGMYEMYHTESLENAFRDLDSLIATGKPAW